MADQAERVEELLREVEAMAGPAVRPHLEALLEALRASDREALRRLVGHARAAARVPSEVDARLDDDATVSALLSAHGISGLRPASPASPELAKAWSPSEMRLEIVAVGDGVISLRVGAPEDGP